MPLRSYLQVISLHSFITLYPVIFIWSYIWSNSINRTPPLSQFRPTGMASPPLADPGPPTADPGPLFWCHWDSIDFPKPPLDASWAAKCVSETTPGPIQIRKTPKTGSLKLARDFNQKLSHGHLLAIQRPPKRVAMDLNGFPQGPSRRQRGAKRTSQDRSGTPKKVPRPARASPRASVLIKTVF